MSHLFIPFVFDFHSFFPFLLSLQKFMLKMRMPCPNNMTYMTMTHDTSVLFGFHAFHIHGIHKAAPVVPTKLTARARKVAHSCPSRKPSSLWRQNEVDFSTKFCLGLSSKVHNLLCTLEACTYSLQLPVVATKLTAIVTLGDSKDLQTWQADTDDQDPIRINYTFEENIRKYFRRKKVYACWRFESWLGLFRIDLSCPFCVAGMARSIFTRF